MAEYTVQVSNIFEADSPEDAVLQMASWLIDWAYEAGYRVYGPDGIERFLDASDCNPEEDA